MPSVLESYFDNKTTDDPKGLGLSTVQYNLLYAVYAWTNAAMVVIAGYFIDKVGNRLGGILFALCCLVGSSLFALVRLMN